MSNILARQKQLAEQARLKREEIRKIPVPPRPPLFPAGPLEEVTPEGIAMGRRRTVKIGARKRRLRMKKRTRRTKLLPKT